MRIFNDQVHDIGEKLKQLAHTITVAESSTGGLISANLLCVPGASRYFVGGSVVYTRQSRQVFLDIDKARIKDLKPLTEEMALEFARAARRKLDATWSIAELGAAGPTGIPYGHEAGISAIAIDGPVTGTVTVETHSDNRQENMLAFTDAALALLAELINRIK